MDLGTTETEARGVPPGAPPDLAVFGDRALLDLSVDMLVAENRAKAARLEAISVFHARRVAEVEARAAGERGPWDDRPGFFLLTPLEATKVEFGPLLGASEMYLQMDLDLTDDLKRWLPGVWRRCRDGRLDLGRAQALQAQLVNLASDDARQRYARDVQAWMDKHDDPEEQPLFRMSRQAVQRAARRICLKHPQRSPEESFADAYKKRRVTLNLGEDGVGALSCITAVHDLMRADHRLTLIAKKRREVEGEERTVAQLRVDTLIDLVHGRLSVAATDGELEEDCAGGCGCAEHEGGEEGASCSDPAAMFDWSAVGQFARSIVNVTVPITTLMGLSDEGGQLAGGVPIPAELARQSRRRPRLGLVPDADRSRRWFHRALHGQLLAQRGDLALDRGQGRAVRVPWLFPPGDRRGARPPGAVAAGEDLDVEHPAAVQEAPQGQALARVHRRSGAGRVVHLDQPVRVRVPKGAA